MRLTKYLAKKIINESHNVINEDVIVANTNGIIIASTDTTRIGQFHEGAVIVSKLRKRIELTKADVTRLKGVKYGINLPILFNDKVIGVIGITGHPSKVSPYGELLRRMTELLIQESYVAEQMEWRERSLEAFVFDWLNIKQWTPEFKKRAEILGVDLMGHRRCAIIQVDIENDFMQREVWWYLQNFLDRNSENNVIVRWGNNRLVLLSKVNGNENASQYTYLFKQVQQSVFERFGLDSAVGIGKAVPALDIDTSYEQAERALRVAIDKHLVILDSDLRLEMCLQDITENTKLEFVKRTLSNLLKEKDLISTLKVYIDSNQSLKDSAEKLHIHINTLHYRLKRIKEITSLNPKNFKELVTLYFAVLCLEETTKS